MTSPLPAGTPLQWPLLRERFPRAWQLVDGAKALVGVIDTGVDASHPDLAPQIAQLVDQQQTLARGPAGTDEEGHGTHVASLACAATGNAIGIAGAGGGCRLLVEKTDLSDGSIAAAIVDATDRGAHAINMSFGDDGSRPASAAIQRALRYAANRDVVLVAAAADEPVREQGDPPTCCSRPAAARTSTPASASASRPPAGTASAPRSPATARRSRSPPTAPPAAQARRRAA